MGPQIFERGDRDDHFALCLSSLAALVKKIWKGKEQVPYNKGDDQGILSLSTTQHLPIQ